MANHKLPCSEGWDQPHAEVRDSPAARMAKRAVKWHFGGSAFKESVTVVDDKEADERQYYLTWSYRLGGTALSDCEKAKALADSLAAKFQPVIDPPNTAVIRLVMWVWSILLCTRKQAHVNEPLKAIRSLKVGKAPGHNCVQNRALKHILLRVMRSSTRSSTRSSELTIFHQYGSTPAWSPFWNTRWSRHYPCFYGPQEF